ncbi:MAG: membrane protein insertase YidC [Gemmatimonadaceae bacterium]
MEKRTILALALAALVLAVTPRLFPGNRPISPAPASDSASGTQPPTIAAGIPPTSNAPSAGQTRSVESVAGSTSTEPAAIAQAAVVNDSLSSFEFSSVGAALSRVVLHSYPDLAKNKSKTPVELSAGATPIVSYRLVTSKDTIDLSKTIFRSVVDSQPNARKRVMYETAIRGARITVEYQVHPDSFITRVRGSISASDSLGDPSYLLIDLPRTLMSFEADTVDDQRHLAFAYRPAGSDAKSLPFGKLDPGEREIVKGPLTWVVTKSKYFLLGVLALEHDSSFVEFSAVGGPRASRTATHAAGTIVSAFNKRGEFAFELYAGPQHWRRLSAIGRDFQNSNPYGGFLQPVVQPFATIVMKILLWMRENLAISYGWVLVIFGIAVRLVLWPLNQKGMRASMKMQRIQPELNEIQKKYKNDPQKMQSEMMRVYKEHDMSPFSTFAGCLPLFLPLPILFALFFVFQNTIEFRGVPFLWFQDISQKDPFYIVPLTMGVSMFVLSWIGMRNTPPNPQTKAMTYIFPVMMTVLFANFPAGLNMYYTIQNLAALPQQWLISNERARNQQVTKT